MRLTVLLALSLVAAGVAADMRPNGFFNRDKNSHEDVQSWGAVRMIASAIEKGFDYVSKSLERAVFDSVEESKTHEVLKKQSDYE